MDEQQTPIGEPVRLRRYTALWNRLRYRPRLGRLFLLITAVFAIFAHFILPPQHVPWRSLDPDAPLGMATGTKITMLAIGPSNHCMKKLEAANALVHTVAPPKKSGKCGYKIAATMTGADGKRLRPAAMTGQCSVVLASYIWLNESDKLAQKYLGSPIAKVHHAGTYSCRRQRGNGSGAWSEHAFANAWDITGFELADGRVISVLKDWNGKGGKEAKARRKFLHEARDKACRLFRVVLSPDYNAAHKDHFHLDQGPYLSCH